MWILDHVRSAFLHFDASEAADGFQNRRVAENVSNRRACFHVSALKYARYADIPREKYNQVSSLNAFIRNIGGSIGIAVVDLISRQTQKHQNYLVPHISNFNPQYRTMVNGISNSLQSAGLNATDANQQAIGRISGMVHAQARTLSYIDVMSMLALIVLCLTPLALLMKYRPPRGAEALH